MDQKSILSNKDAFNSLYNISQILNTGLSQEELVLCVKLCEKGINPNMLAILVREMKKEVKKQKEQSHNQNANKRGSERRV